MFCIQDPDHHHHHPRRILRTFRSHKSLKSATRSQDMTHQRHPSDASSDSATRSSAESSRPSTTRPARVVDWDPLRLHPPMATSHLPFAPQQQSTSARSHRNPDLRQARSLHDLNGANASTRRSNGNPSVDRQPPTPQPRTVIYGGFDFGFDPTAQASRRRDPMQELVDLYTDRPHSPSGSSISSGSDFGPETPTDSAFHLQGLTPRPHPAGLDAADYFIKRGGWKRRGIVFEPEVPMASEECFDLEMD